MNHDELSEPFFGGGASSHSEKIAPAHLERLAVVYVRQSTAQQVLDHQESTRLRYGLVGRARAMGWSKERILLIDDDLGKSAASAQGRVGFQRLVSEVSLDHVGLILGVEVSRGWHALRRTVAPALGDLRALRDADQRS